MRRSPTDAGGRLSALALFTFGAAALRLVPHPWNLTPIAGIALFGGAHFRDRRLAFGIPLAAMLASDAALALAVHGSGAFRGAPFVYAAFVLTACLGRLLAARRSAAAVAGASVAAALLFYVISNLGVWLLWGLYPMTAQGLVACYVTALPYLRNAVAGNLLYAAVLLGGFALVERGLPGWRRGRASPAGAP